MMVLNLIVIIWRDNDAHYGIIFGRFRTEVWRNKMTSKSEASINVKIGVSELGKVKPIFDKKNLETNGAAGRALGAVTFGANGGYFRKYENGIIYLLPPNGPCWVCGDILAEYLSLGADKGFLGYPTTDERVTPDGIGRYTHFQGGSIYWMNSIGAHEIHGAIRDKWASLGWEKSLLGFPISGERSFAGDGRVSQFQNGAIYWWPDVGALDLGKVSVKYRGLYCFGETDEASSSDEPYVIFGVLATPETPGSTPESQIRTQIYSDVDAGDSRPDNVEIFRGDPHGLVVGIALCEHDLGDPDSYLNLMKVGVGLGGKAVSAGCGAVFGAEAAATCDSIWKEVGPKIVSALNDLAGTGDDLIGKVSLQITAKEMVQLARQPWQNFWGIKYHRESELLSDGEASYKVYFSVDAI